MPAGRPAQSAGFDGAVGLDSKSKTAEEFQPRLTYVYSGCKLISI